MTAAILVIDPSLRLAPAVLAALEARFDVDHSVGAAGSRAKYDLALVAPDAANPAQICRELRDAGVADGVVVLAAGATLRDALGALRAQAADFVPDGDDADAVLERVSSVLERMALERELRDLRACEPTPDEILGESPGMQRLRKRIERAAASDVTVLISGESGAGKDLVAHAIHATGPRRAAPFVPVHCSSIPHQLLESEFFGHVRGAFTDAMRDRAGLLVQASGGTLLLDEIGEMPLELQAKLLRALQQRSVRPLGHTREVAFDVRVVAATSKNLEREVLDGRFREDLFFRLNVLQVRIPPLRERGRDVLLLAQHFIRRASTPKRPVVGLTPGAARALLAYGWPGNVRELEHCITSATANAQRDHIRTADLPASILRRGRAAPSDRGELQALSDVEQSHILSVLESVAGNRARASKLLGLDRSTLYRKLKAYGLVRRTSPARDKRTG